MIDYDVSDELHGLMNNGDVVVAAIHRGSTPNSVKIECATVQGPLKVYMFNAAMQVPDQPVTKFVPDSPHCVATCLAQRVRDMRIVKESRAFSNNFSRQVTRMVLDNGVVVYADRTVNEGGHNE